jgi:hypothetical protein
MKITIGYDVDLNSTSFSHFADFIEQLRDHLVNIDSDYPYVKVDDTLGILEK